MGAVQFLFLHFLQFARHHIFNLMRVIGIHADHAKVIANDRNGVMILQDIREFLEGSAFLGLFDMRFDRHRPLGLRKAHQPEQKAQ